MDKLNVGVIGCGSHSSSHFAMIAQEPRLCLAAIVDIDPERRKTTAAEHGPERAFADYREMLDTCNLDLVQVLTMPGHLVPIVLDCLQRDLHTVVEKPPGMSSDQTREMAAAAGKSKGKAMVSFNRRYFPEVLAVRRLARERGGASHAAATYNKPVTRLGTPTMAGIAPDPVICDAIHHVDLLRWLVGPTEGKAAIPVEVHAEVQDGDRPGSHRHAAVVRFDVGSIATLTSYYGVGYRIQRAEVHADDFSAYLDLTDSQHRRCELYEAPGASKEAQARPMEQPLDLEAVGGPGFNETRHFVDCILEDREAWSTLGDAVVTMGLSEAIRRGHKGKLTGPS